VYILLAVQNKQGEKHERNYWRFSSGGCFLCVFSSIIFILRREKMKTTVEKWAFRQAFKDAERENNFSYQGLNVLWDYFDEYEQSTGEEIEFDVIAICCEFNESTPDEIREDYGIDADIDLMEYLQYHTQVAGVTEDGSIVYAAF
jgi:hypothetical protein